MKQRNIVLVMLFGLITFGIYDLFWLKSTRDEMVAKGANIPKFYILILPVLLLAGLTVLQFVIRGTFAGGLPGNEAGDPVRTIVNIVTVIGGIIAVVAAIPIMLYWSYRYSEGVDHVTNGSTSTATSFGLFLLASVFGFFFVWPGIIQNSFNLLPAKNPQA